MSENEAGNTRTLISRMNREAFRDYWKCTDTNLKVTALAVAAQAVFGFVVFIDMNLTNLSLIRPLISVSLLSLLPGILILGILGIDLDSTSSFVYAIAISIIAVIGTGTVLNVVFLRSPGYVFQTSPLTEGTLVTTFITLFSVGTVVFRYSGREPALPNLWIIYDRDPALYYALLLPMLAIIGATLLKWFDENLLLLIFFALVAVTPYLIFHFEVNERYYPLITWCVGTALLFQKTLATYYLHTGDGSKEFYFANLVLANGFWDPTLPQPKNGMLSIVILQPVFTIVSDIPLMLFFKAVHPVLFGVLGIVLYQLYAHLLSEKYALIAALMTLFLHVYFVILAENTRTAMSLFFVATTVLLNIDSKINRTRIVFLTTILLTGIITTHYGIGYLFMGVFAVAILSNSLLSRLSGINVSRAPILSAPVGALYIIVGLTWYYYTTSASIFSLFVVLPYRAVERLESLFNPELSSAGHAVSGSPQSMTFAAIKLEYFLLTLLAGIGFLLVALHLFDNSYETYPFDSILDHFVPSEDWIETRVRSEFLYLATGSIGLLVLAFAPVSAIGIGRVVLTAFLLLSPFAVLGFVFLFDAISGDDLSTRALSVVLLTILLINSGSVATIFSHGSSPQPQLLGQTDEKGTFDQLSIYHQFNRIYDVQAAEWIIHHRTDEDAIFGPIATQAIPSYYHYTEYDLQGVKPPGNYRVLRRDVSQMADGYVYFSAFTTASEKAMIARGPSSTAYKEYDFINIDNLTDRADHRIYANGKSALFRTGD